MSYRKDLVIKVSISFVILIALSFLLGGRIYQEYFINNFTPEWKKFVRTKCDYFTALDPIVQGLIGHCRLETIKRYNDMGALPVEGDKCPQGYIMTQPALCVGFVPACFPINSREIFTKPRVEFQMTSDFDTFLGFPCR